MPILDRGERKLEELLKELTQSKAKVKTA